MDCDWCPRCGALVWDTSIHRCPPEWEVWCHDYDQDRVDAHTVYAVDASNAAEKWAEHEDNQGDYDIVGGSEVVVCVAKKDEEEIEVYRVSGRPEPVYSAKEISDCLEKDKYIKESTKEYQEMKREEEEEYRGDEDDSEDRQTTEEPS